MKLTNLYLFPLQIYILGMFSSLTFTCGTTLSSRQVNDFLGTVEHWTLLALARQVTVLEITWEDGLIRTLVFTTHVYPTFLYRLAMDIDLLSPKIVLGQEDNVIQLQFSLIGQSLNFSIRMYKSHVFCTGCSDQISEHFGTVQICSPRFRKMVSAVGVPDLDRAKMYWNLIKSS